MSLGGCYRDLGVLDKAIEMSAKALEIAEGKYGVGNIVTSTYLNSLGLAYKANKEFEKALKCFERALAIRTDFNGVDHPESVSIRHNLGKLYLEWGQPEKAREYIAENLDIMQNSINKDKETSK